MNVNANKPVANLDYDQTVSQLNKLKDNDVLCLKDGKLGAWTKGTGDGGPNTSDVLSAVRNMMLAKMGTGVFSSSDVNKGMDVIDKLRNSKSAKSKNNYVFVKDIKDFIKGFKDINAKPVTNTAECVKTEEPKKTEVKTVGSIPEPGEVLTMTRDELEKNLESWIKAGYTVKVTVEGEGSYQLQGRSGENAASHEYDTLFTSADRSIVNEPRKFLLPETSYSVSQSSAKPEVAKPEVGKPEVAKPEVAKPEVAKTKVAKSNDTTSKTIEITVKKPKVASKPEFDFVKKQTNISNTCFLWSLRNSILSAKNANQIKKVMVWNDRPENSDKLCVYVKGELKAYSVADLEEVAKKKRVQGSDFLKRCDDMKLQPFEKKFLLYLFVTDKEFEGKCRDALGYRTGLPMYESSKVAPLFGLQTNVDVRFAKDNPPSADTLQAFKEALGRGEQVTMNVGNSHYLSVLNVNTATGKVECLDSLHKIGEKVEYDIKKLCNSYSSVSLVAYGPHENKVEATKKDFVEYLNETLMFDKSPTSKLHKDFEQRFGKNVEGQNILLHKSFIFEVATAFLAKSQPEQQKLLEKDNVKECLNNLEARLRMANNATEYLSAIAEVCTSLDLVNVNQQ